MSLNKDNCINFINSRSSRLWSYETDERISDKMSGLLGMIVQHFKEYSVTVRKYCNSSTRPRTVCNFSSKNFDIGDLVHSQQGATQ